MKNSKGLIPTTLLLSLLLTLACGPLVLPSPQPEVTDQPAATPTFTALPAATPTSASTSELPNEPAIPPEVIQEMTRLEEQVITLRGLHPNKPAARALLTPEELRQHVLDDFLGDYSPEEAITDARVLAMLDLLDPGVDLHSLYVDLLTEQVAGFYDDETKQLYVVAADEFGAMERFAYAHEYVHVLQDQTYDLQQGLQYNDESCEADSERCAAIQALVEGDASLVGQQWLSTYASQQDLQDLIEGSSTSASSVFLSAPRFLQEDFLFPYMEGVFFVQQVYLRGGWPAVDGAYFDLPKATEQILHPERYPNDKPVWLQVPDDLAARLGEGWAEIDRDVLGEWYTRLMLEQRLPEAEASLASEGWGGDFFLAFYNQALDEGAFVMVTAWDRYRDGEEFFTSLQACLDARLGEHVNQGTITTWNAGQDAAILKLDAGQTLWILAPDKELVQLLEQAISFPSPRQ